MPSGSPPGNPDALAASAPASRYSIVAGTTPLASTRSIASQPSRTPANAPTTGTWRFGAGRSRSQALVTIPRVPSLPQSSPVRS